MSGRTERRGAEVVTSWTVTDPVTGQRFNSRRAYNAAVTHLREHRGAEPCVFGHYGCAVWEGGPCFEENRDYALDRLTRQFEEERGATPVKIDYHIGAGDEVEDHADVLERMERFLNRSIMGTATEEELQELRSRVGHVREVADELRILRHDVGRMRTAILRMDLTCEYDPANPCWDDRATDRVGLHWGGGEACPSCVLTANARVTR